MQSAAALGPALAQSLSDLAPYLAVMAAGFLVGAWGQAAKVPLAIAVGILLILMAAAAFVLTNDSGDSGVPNSGVAVPLIPTDTR